MIIRVCDVETSGLEPPEAAVVEFAYCDLHADEPTPEYSALDWKVIGGSSWFCDPGHPIPPEVSAVNHIVDSDVAGHPPFEAICRGLFGEGPGSGEIVAVAAHNNRFDRKWLTDELIGERRWIDTYRAALRLWPDAPGHNLQTLRYWRRPADLDRALALPHRAYGDAYVAAHVLLDMLAVTSGKQLVAWSTGPALLPRFTFGKHAMKPIANIDDGYLDWMLGQDFDEDVLFTVKTEIERRLEEFQKEQAARATADEEPVF